MGENLGNIYTGSLYSGLCSLLCDDECDLRVIIKWIRWVKILVVFRIKGW